MLTKTEAGRSDICRCELKELGDVKAKQTETQHEQCAGEWWLPEGWEEERC